MFSNNKNEYPKYVFDLSQCEHKVCNSFEEEEFLKRRNEELCRSATPCDLLSINFLDELINGSEGK